MENLTSIYFESELTVEKQSRTVVCDLSPEIVRADKTRALARREQMGLETQKEKDGRRQRAGSREVM